MDRAGLAQGAVLGDQAGQGPVLAGWTLGGAERCWSSTRARRAMVSRSPAPAIRTATAEEPRRGAAGWMP